MAAIALLATDGRMIDLAALRGRSIVYAYPRTGQPGIDNPPGWDLIPLCRASRRAE
jgi:peroxiredoxin